MSNNCSENNDNVASELDQLDSKINQLKIELDKLNNHRKELRNNTYIQMKNDISEKFVPGWYYCKSANNFFHVIDVSIVQIEPIDSTYKKYNVEYIIDANVCENYVYLNTDDKHGASIGFIWDILCGDHAGWIFITNIYESELLQKWVKKHYHSCISIIVNS